ncbi:MAG: M16 family metallopeptidase [Terriglobia bacterium]
MCLCRAAALFCCVALASNAWAARKPALPAGMPGYGPVVAFHAPRVVVRKLTNGLTLWLVPRAGFPKVALAVAIRGGYAADPAKAPGISNLLIDTIDQGTHRHTAIGIADEFEAAGGELEGQPVADADLLTASVLASKLAPALSVLSDVMRNATFPALEVALAQRDEEDTLNAREADPQFIASRAIARALFSDHPYSIVAPTQSALAHATPGEIRSLYAREFRPDQTLLVAIGDFSVEGFMRSVKGFFGSWSAPRTPPVTPAAPPAKENPHDIFMVARPHSVQTGLVLGAFGPTEGRPDFPSAEVANAIYGTMYGSLLFTVVREQKGYSYSPRSTLHSRRRAGTIETTANARNAVTGACLNEVLMLLTRMATASPSAQQLVRAQRYLAGTEAIRYQSQANLAKRLATLWVEELPAGEIERESAAVAAVTPEEVKGVGAKYFAPQRTSIVAVGDAVVIRRQLAPLGIPLKSLP